MVRITNPADCCGCTACASICNHNAISMQPDVLGFLYPVVDKDKCTECGLCEKVCAFHDNYDKSMNLVKPEAYAARHKDMKEVETSRSGATFIAISDYIIENGGVVYGAVIQITSVLCISVPLLRKNVMNLKEANMYKVT